MSAVTAPARPAAARSPAPPPRTAFVLAGGAALGAMQAGTLRALYEHGIVPDLPTAGRGQHRTTGGHLRRTGILPLRLSTLISGLADAAATRDRPPAKLDVTR